MCELARMSTFATQSRRALLLAGLVGLTGVALGALGAHALRAALLERGTLAAWETGARYHMFHAVAIFAAAIWLRSTNANTGRLALWAARCWSVGVVLFSGSLYWLGLGGGRWLGPVTPVGGVALLIGWALVFVAGLSKEPADPK